LFHHDLQEFKARGETDARDILALAGIARDALAFIQSLERIATAHQTRLDGH
jgi:hypothetical protein